MNKRYDYKDFQAIVDRKMTLKQVAEKYNTTPDRIHRAMNRAGYYISNRKIIIISPYKRIECRSVAECAKQLNVSTTSIVNALKGKNVNIFKELNIKIVEEKNENLNENN